MRFSRWHTVYLLLAANCIGLVLCVRPIVRYWPTITSTFHEVLQCVGLSR